MNKLKWAIKTTATDTDTYTIARALSKKVRVWNFLTTLEAINGVISALFDCWRLSQNELKNLRCLTALSLFMCVNLGVCWCAVVSEFVSSSFCL